MTKIALNIPDCHIPWHDEKAYNIMIAIAKDVEEAQGIDEINIMGDFADFYGVKLWDKLPAEMSLKETLKDEIYQVNKKLDELRRAFPNAVINFIEGNHEDRLRRYIVKNCQALYDLPEFTIPAFFKFKERKIKYIPFGRNQLHRCLGSNYCLRHRPYNSGKHCAATSSHNKHISLGFGDTHRKQSYTSKDAFGREITCYSMGWLGDPTACVYSYMDTDNWTQAFQLVYVLSPEEYFVHTIDIKNHKAIYNGVLYYE